MTDQTDLDEIKEILEEIKQTQKEFDDRIDYLEQEMNRKNQALNDIRRTQKDHKQKIHFINTLLD